MVLSLKYPHFQMPLQFPSCPIKLSYNPLKCHAQYFFVYSPNILLLGCQQTCQAAPPSKDLDWVYSGRGEKDGEREKEGLRMNTHGWQWGSQASFMEAVSSGASPSGHWQADGQGRVEHHSAGEM